MFSPIRDFYYQLANKYFFTSIYDSHTVVAQLSGKLGSTLEDTTIYNFITDALRSAMHTDLIGIYVFDSRNIMEAALGGEGFKKDINQFFQTGNSFYEEHVARDGIVVMSEIKRSAPEKTLLNPLITTFDWFNPVAAISTAGIPST